METHPIVASVMLTATLPWQDALIPTPQVPIVTETPFRAQRAAAIFQKGAPAQVPTRTFTKLVVTVCWTARVCEENGSDVWSGINLWHDHFVHFHCYE